VKRTYQRITNTHVEAMRDFVDSAAGGAYTIWDSDVRGLLIRVGRHKATWIYLEQRRFRGKRKHKQVRLGFFPAMDIKAARKAAKVRAGISASGVWEPGLKDAIKLGEAFENYIAYPRLPANRRPEACGL
jgi:hypothetical protein